MKIHSCDKDNHCDENLSMGQNLSLHWKPINAIQMYHCDENLLLWWDFIAVIKFIILMIYHIYHLVIWGLLTKLTNFAFLQIVNFGYFDICPDGWLGWKSRSETISAQLKLDFRAELGNIALPILYRNKISAMAAKIQSKHPQAPAINYTLLPSLENFWETKGKTKYGPIVISHIPENT